MPTELLNYSIYASINANQDFSLLTIQTTGSACHAYLIVSVVIIVLIVQSVLRVKYYISILALTHLLTLVLINALMDTMLMLKMNVRNALITARLAITTILARYATQGLSKLTIPNFAILAPVLLATIYNLQTAQDVNLNA